MPNSRYEREIEEILNRMGDTDPQKDSNARVRPFRRPRARRPRTFSFPQFPVSQTFFLIAVALILIASGISFYENGSTWLSGVIGAAGLLFFVMALVVGWRSYFRPSTPRWRGTSLNDNPNRRSPFGGFMDQFRLWRLRQQYRQGQRDQGAPDD